MRPHREDQPVRTLLSELTHEATTLVRKEAELARVEMGDKMSDTMTAMTSMAAGGAVLLLGVLFLLLAAMLALDAYVIHRIIVSALIVGVVVSVVGAILLAVGRRRMAARSLTPEMTIRSLQRDAELARTSMARSA